MKNWDICLVFHTKSSKSGIGFAFTAHRRATFQVLHSPVWLQTVDSAGLRCTDVGKMLASVKAPSPLFVKRSIVHLSESLLGLNEIIYFKVFNTKPWTQKLLKNPAVLQLCPGHPICLKLYPRYKCNFRADKLVIAFWNSLPSIEKTTKKRPSWWKQSLEKFHWCPLKVCSHIKDLMGEGKGMHLTLGVAPVRDPTVKWSFSLLCSWMGCLAYKKALIPLNAYRFVDIQI